MKKTQLKEKAIVSLKIIDRWYKDRKKKLLGRFITPENLKILAEDGNN